MPGKRKSTKYGEEVYRDTHIAWFNNHGIWYTYYKKQFTGVTFDRKKDAKRWLREKTDTDKGDAR